MDNWVYYLPGEEGQMDRKRLSRRLGFTLMEVMVTVVLLGMVGLSFAYLYVTAQRFTLQSLSFTATQNEASFALEHIKRNLLLATAIATPAVGAPQGPTLQFTWRPNFQEVADLTSRYEINGTDLRFIRDTGNPGVFDTISRNISAVTFTRVNVSRVDIEVQSQRTSGVDTARTTRLQTSVSPRGVFQ